jgi:hypothetical protein
MRPGISLGAVDVSTAALEPVDELLGRIDPVADERGDADVAVATNGGFAQVADQPLMSAAEQHAKLQLVEVVTRYCWETGSEPPLWFSGQPGPSPWKARRCSARASMPKSAVRSRTTEWA